LLKKMIEMARGDECSKLVNAIISHGWCPLEVVLHNSGFIIHASYFVEMVPTYDNWQLTIDKRQFVIGLNADSLTDNTPETKNRIGLRKQAWKGHFDLQLLRIWIELVELIHIFEWKERDWFANVPRRYLSNVMPSFSTFLKSKSSQKRHLTGTEF
jgi:hypothetical protein